MRKQPYCNQMLTEVMFLGNHMSFL